MMLPGLRSADHWPPLKPRNYCQCRILQLLHILIAQVESREISSLTPLRPNENTTIVATFKVSLPLDRSIILARRLIKRDADPDTNPRDLGHRANIRYRASAGIRFREEAHTTRKSQACLLVSVSASKFVEAGDQYSRCSALAPNMRGSCKMW